MGPGWAERGDRLRRAVDAGGGGGCAMRASGGHRRCGADTLWNRAEGGRTGHKKSRNKFFFLHFVVFRSTSNMLARRTRLLII
jgi:hypothetical protein